MATFKGGLDPGVFHFLVGRKTSQLISDIPRMRSANTTRHRTRATAEYIRDPFRRVLLDRPNRRRMIGSVSYPESSSSQKNSGSQPGHSTSGYPPDFRLPLLANRRRDDEASDKLISAFFRPSCNRGTAIWIISRSCGWNAVEDFDRRKRASLGNHNRSVTQANVKGLMDTLQFDGASTSMSIFLRP